MKPRAAKLLHGSAWAAITVMLGLCVSQWFGIEGRRTIAVLQALTPFVLAPALPLALTASLLRRHALALTALLPSITFLALSHPIVFHPDPPAVAADAPRVTIGFSNVLEWNPSPAEAAATIAGFDTDVVLVVELTPSFAARLDALLGAAYPYRAQPVGPDLGGVGLWSRVPIVSGGLVRIGGRASVDVVVDVDGARVRVVGVHPRPPTTDATAWRHQIDAIGDHLDGSPWPTVVVGDFNGSRWLPSFRRLLHRGWRDAHELVGRGFSVSWPMDTGWLPPGFIRLDHLLVGDGIAPTWVRDVVVPGSDHKAITAEVGLTD